ncbi:MAG: RNA polymerase sigma factor [Acidobacteriota bacterium]
MNRVQAGEENAFQELFSQFRSKVYGTALRILKEEHCAQDALQETFLNIYRAAHNFRGDSKIGTWINRITVNVCLEILRRNRKHRLRTDEDVSEQAWLEDSRSLGPFERACQSELRAQVQRALSRLGQKHRSVVRLHDLEEYTIREIAEILRLAEGTVKSRLFYGRKALEKELMN